MNYVDLRQANADAYRASQASWMSLGMPNWGQLGRFAAGHGLDPQDVFNRIHAASVISLAAQDAQQPVNWANTFSATGNGNTVAGADGAISGPELIATILTAVLGVVCPALGVAAPLIEPILQAIIQVILNGLSSGMTTGTFGGAAGVSAALQQFALEAQAT